MGGRHTSRASRGRNRPRQAQGAADHDWPRLVLVAAVPLVGLVADKDRFFSATGQRLAGIARSGVAPYTWAVLLGSTVTAALNLDT